MLLCWEPEPLTSRAQFAEKQNIISMSELLKVIVKEANLNLIFWFSGYAFSTKRTYTEYCLNEYITSMNQFPT